MYLWEYIEKEYFFFNLRFNLFKLLIFSIAQVKWRPRWAKWNSGSAILPQAKNIVSNPQPRGEKKKVSTFALQKMEEKKSFCYFTHNNVLNYCIVRSECVLGRTVCFRFVSSIGAMDLVWHVCVVRCWCIAFILVIYM